MNTLMRLVSKIVYNELKEIILKKGGTKTEIPK